MRDQVIAALVNAIKAQQTQIEVQQKQIEGLKQELEARIAKLESTPRLVPSDVRVKKEIRPYINGLSIIKRINPVWFKYNGKAGFPNDNQYHIEVIAQEIAKVAPYTVNSFPPMKLNPEDKELTLALRL